MRRNPSRSRATARLGGGVAGFREATRRGIRRREIDDLRTMAKLDILIAPDRRLRTKCTPLGEVDDATRRLLDDMLETMYAAPGVGLAAPQVGVLKRLVVMDCARDEEEPDPLKLVDPEIVWRSDEIVTGNEGCLSLPEIYVDVDRPEAARVAYLDENGTAQEIEVDGLRARCLQHEIDHLNGVLHVDYLSAIKRGVILRRLDKSKRRKKD